MNVWIWSILPLSVGLAWLCLRWLRRALTPERLPHPVASPDQPEAVWVQIPTCNGKVLRAQWLPARAAPGGGGCGSAILMHGWGGNGSQLRPAADALWRQGWSALLPDARSHGLSDADTYSALPRFAEDLEACLDWLQAQAAIPAAPVVLLGHSVGAAAALLSASRREGLAAVVGVSAFAHPEEVMRRWLARYHVPFWPVGWLVNRYIEQVIGHRFDEIAPLHRIGRIRAPVLLVHGSDDAVVPLACARRLQAAAAHATLLQWPGRHDGFEDEAGLHQRVSEWLDSVLDDQLDPRVGFPPAISTKICA